MLFRSRQAWEALRAYYEGEDYVNRTIQECLTKVRTMYYRGETPRFNFERFIDRQKECYKRLRDVGYNGGIHQFNINVHPFKN